METATSPEFVTWASSEMFPLESMDTGFPPVVTGEPKALDCTVELPITIRCANTHCW